jgi:hypothetical protein
MRRYGTTNRLGGETIRTKKPIKIDIPPHSKEVNELLSPDRKQTCKDCDLLVSRIHEMSLLLNKSETEKQEIFVSLTQEHKNVLDKLNELYIENSKLMEELMNKKESPNHSEKIEEQKEIEKEIEKREEKIEKLEIEVEKKIKADKLIPRVARLAGKKKERD